MQTQNERARQEKEFWDALKLLADENKTKEFYQLYVKYLDWAGVISLSRKAIYKMAWNVAYPREDDKLYD